MRHALVNAAGLVVNIVEIDDISNWTAPSGHEVIAAVAGVNIGDIWDGSKFIAPPGPQLPLTDIQTSALRKIDAARDAVLSMGYIDTVTGKTYQCDPVARGNWTAMFLASTWPGAVDIQVITADNSTITLPPANLQSLFAIRIMPWVQSVIYAGRAYKDTVLAAVDEAGVNAVLDGLVWPA